MSSARLRARNPNNNRIQSKGNLFHVMDRVTRCNLAVPSESVEALRLPRQRPDAGDGDVGTLRGQRSGLDRLLHISDMVRCLT
jgi:hypothetical protein